MQSSSTFIRIAGTVTEVKKSAVINDCGNISYWEERAKQSIREQVLFVPNTVGCLGGVTTIGKVCNFYPHWSLEPVFAVLKLTRNYYVIYEQFFFLQTGNLIV